MDEFYAFKELVVRNQNLLFKSKIHLLGKDMSPEEFQSIVHIKIEPQLGEDAIAEGADLAISSITTVAEECLEDQKELVAIKSEDDPLAGEAEIGAVPDLEMDTNGVSEMEENPFRDAADRPLSALDNQRLPQRTVNGSSTYSTVSGAETEERRPETMKRSWAQANEGNTEEESQDTTDEESQDGTEEQQPEDPLQWKRKTNSFGLPMLPELPSLPALPKLPKLTKSFVVYNAEPEDELTRAFSMEYEKWSLNVDASIKRFFPVLPCKLCDRRFQTFGALRLHVDEMHYGQKEWFSCCGRNFRSRSELCNHINYHVGTSRLIKCDSCLLVFLSATKLRDHNEKFHGSGVPCPFCKAEFGCKLQMSIHAISHLPNSSISCPKCPDTTFASRELLLVHLEKDHTEAEFFESTICPFKLDIKSQLILHKPLANNGLSSSFLCPQCGASFPDDRGFIRHISRGRMEEAGNRLDCPDCGLVFPDLKRLRMHVVNVHERKDR